MWLVGKTQRDKGKKIKDPRGAQVTKQQVLENLEGNLLFKQ